MTQYNYIEKDLLCRARGLLAAASKPIAMFEESRRLIRKLIAIIDEKYPKCDPFDSAMLPKLLADVQRGGLAWKFLIEEISFKKVDRRASMLKGPFFINEEYPIPRKKDGKLMVPIVQSDLRDLSKLRGLPLGDGLLQAWWAWDEWECRVIPREIVRNSEPLPFPTDINDFSENEKCFIEDWMAPESYFGSDRIDEERVVPVLLGYDDPFICIHSNIDDATWEGFIAERIGGIETEVSTDEDLDAVVVEFKNRLVEDGYEGDELASNPEPKEYSRLIKILRQFEEDHRSGDHAFGSFHGIHRSPYEIEEDTLFVFESEYFSFGGAGNAHVFYGFKNGSPYFYMDWANCR